MESVSPWGILDALSDGLAVVDARGALRWRNATWRQLDARFAEGCDLTDACAGFFDNGGAAVGAGLREVLGGRERFEADCGWDAHRASIAVTPLAVDGARGALVRLRDVTEERAALKARDEFLSIAAHELKTPLTSVRGFAEWLARAAERGIPVDESRRLAALRTIDRQSEKMAGLVDRLLDVSRIQSGRMDLQRRPTDVVALVGEIVATAQTRTARHTIDLAAPPSVVALVDPLRIEQAVGNLIDNAIKYSPAGGPVRIAIESPAPDTLVLRVADRGIGVRPEERPRLFERFFQGSHHVGGMGLGLYICREIVERHGGTVEATFPDEGGSCFHVTLPVGERPAT